MCEVPKLPGRPAGIFKDIKPGWIECRQCRFCETRKRMVFGDGNEQAHIVLVGEAPGPEENECGLPFVGPSGEMLDQMVTYAGGMRSELYITNVMGCLGEGVKSKPNINDIKQCMPRVHEIIRRIDPVMIIAAGDIALHALTGKHGIEAAHGHIQMGKVPGKYMDIIYPVFPIVHPAKIHYEGDIGPKSWAEFTTAKLYEMFKTVDELVSCYKNISPPTRKIIYRRTR